MADLGGLTATATATLRVRPVNDAPVALETIPEQVLEEGGNRVTLDLTPYFDDVDGDVLTYTAESSDPAAATVTVAGSTLTLTAVLAGAATVTVTASDPAGLTATQTFGVAVGDRLVRAVLTDTLAAMGRGHLSSVRQTVGRRLDSGGGDTQRLMVAGQFFGPGAWNRLGPGGLVQTHAWLTRAASLRQRFAAPGLAGTPADPQLQPLAANGAFSGVGNVGWDQALQGTDVLLTFGGGGQTEVEAPGRQRRWTIWGQGDLQAFRGTPEAAVGDYEGDLRTAYLGVDALAGRRWLFGVAVGRSAGRGTWQAGTAAGQLKTTLTTVYPYLRWGSGDTTVMAVAGAGRGTASLARAAVENPDASPLRLALGLLEGRRRLATVGRGLRIGLRGEASLARLATGEGDETIDALQAGVQRLRGGIELTQDLDAFGGSTLTPFGAVSARHDGGAGQTGVGLEVAGGMRLRGGRLQVEAQGRRLVLHSATGYSDHGVSLAASVGAGSYQPGLRLTVRPTWGTAGMGADTLWQDHFQIPSQDTGYDTAGIDALVAYGLRLGEDALLEPFGGYGQRAGLGRRLQLGARLGALGQVPGLFGGPVQLELTGERYERPGSPSDHRFSMVGVINFGAQRPKPPRRARTARESGTALRSNRFANAPVAREPAQTPADDLMEAPIEPAAPTALPDLVEALDEPPAAFDAVGTAPLTLPVPTWTPLPRRTSARDGYRASRPSPRSEREMVGRQGRSVPPAATVDRSETLQDAPVPVALADVRGPDGDPRTQRLPGGRFSYLLILLILVLWATRRVQRAIAAGRAANQSLGADGGEPV